MEEEKIKRLLRVLLFILFLWDLLLGTATIIGASYIQKFLRLAIEKEPIFTRGVGLFWLFASYIYYLGYKDPIKNVIAVKLTIVFRILAGLFDLVESLFLLPKPFYFLHYILFVFVICNFLIAGITIYFLKKLKIK
jgi:hypothetical protein